MKYIMLCRRTFMATLGMVILAGLGAYKGMDVAPSIAAIAMGLAAANSYEKSNKSKTRTGGS